jgi:micrococcal nuclease
MTRRRSGCGPAVLVVVAVAGAVTWWQLTDAADEPPPAAPVARPASATGPFPVGRVVDGDTLIVLRDGTEERVRLLGIDTPESVKPDSPVECFGPEASARTAELVSGRSVWLEADPTQGAVDQYGRTLAYVWLDDGTMVNRTLVAEGYAREYTYDVPGAYQATLAEAQTAAQDAGAGLWGSC